MKMEVISVYDNIAEVYSNPVCVQSKGAGVRSFMDAVNDKESNFAKHPEHYSLFYLGSFDTDCAEFNLVKSPQLLMNAWEVSKQ